MRFKCTSCVVVAGLVAGLGGLPAHAQDNAAANGSAPTAMTDDSMMMDKMTAGMTADDKKMMMDMMGNMSADQHRVMMQGMQQGMMQGKMMGNGMMDDKMMMKSMTKGMSKSDRKMMMDMMGRMTPEQKMMMQRAMMGQHMMGGMMGNGMMSDSMMPMLDETMKSYMAADQPTRNQMLDKMSLSQMVQFLTRLYAMPGAANMMPMMGNNMKPGMMQDNK